MIIVKRVIKKLLSITTSGYWVLRIAFYNLLNKYGLFDQNDRIGRILFDIEWENRIKKVVESKWNLLIARSEMAGVIMNGYQIMHNGLKVTTGSYYGLAISKMLFLNKGVHEPEEEAIFDKVLKNLPPGSTMIEMGSYWSFYSMWFRRENGGLVYMIEPDAAFLAIGKKNFLLNELTGSFDQFFIDSKSANAEGVPRISLDDFLSYRNIAHLGILHADIQGYELDMLVGAENALSNKVIQFLFISTHSNQLHSSCVNYLSEKGYNILYSLDLDQISSVDGLIVASTLYFEFEL